MLSQVLAPLLLAGGANVPYTDVTNSDFSPGYSGFLHKNARTA